MAEARLDPGLLIPIPFPCTAPALPLRDHSAGWAVLNIRLLLIDNFFFYEDQNYKKVGARGSYKERASQAESTEMTSALRQEHRGMLEEQMKMSVVEN